MNIYVANISYNTSDEDIKDLFTEYGEVAFAKIIKDRDSGRSKGFGFVEMPNDEHAKSAIEGLDGREVDGRPLKVNVARDRK